MDQTSEARVKEIEERLQKASPGPWDALPEEVGKAYIRIRGTVLGARYKIANVICPTYDGLPDREIEETRNNADLIAHAPDDIRYLLDELKKAREALRAIARRANESGIDILAERETIYAMHGIAREALKDKK